MYGPPPPPSPPLPPPPPAHRPKGRRKLLVAAAVLGALIAALAVVVYEFEPGGPQNPYKVRVTEVNWLQDGALFSSSPGFTKDAGKSATVTLSLYCATGFLGPETCESGSVFLESAGFGLESTNAPFSWSSGNGGAYSTLTVTVSLPLTSYTGNLTINLD